MTAEKTRRRTIPKRKKRRRKDRDAAVPQTRAGSETRFVVGSSSGADGGSSNFDLGHEVNLVKAALLYADRVELVSVGASILAGWVELRDTPHQKRVELIREHGCHWLDPGNLEKLELVMGSGKRARMGGLDDRERIRARIQLRAVLDKGWEDLTRRVEGEFEAYNARGLREAVGSGLLRLHSFGHTDAEGLLTMAADRVPVSVAVEDVVLEYVERASVALEGSGYPLFDALIGELVGESVRADLIVPSPDAIHRGRHGGLSGDLTRRLPLFEEATVEEILGVRRELERPLRGFRLAVSEFSGEVASAAWEPGFAAEADTLFREKVEPEVAGIEEALRENRSLRELAWRTARHGATPGTIGALFGSADALAGLAGTALGLGYGAARSLLDRRETGKVVEGNQLYFYYQAGKLLERGA
ncbi:MAG: hypothetical protein ACR2KW_07230 [Rubrobacter sp.]